MVLLLYFVVIDRFERSMVLDEQFLKSSRVDICLSKKKEFLSNLPFAHLQASICVRNLSRSVCRNETTADV